MKAGDPLETIELVSEVPPLTLPHAGVYSFDVVHDYELLGSYRVLAALKEEPEEGD